MNLLDENILASQRRQLRDWRISVRQIGFDIGRKGMSDDEIIPFLHGLRRPTLFTRDRDFYKRRLCHARYCLVSLAVDKRVVAVFVRRLLRHPEFDAQAKRLGTVVRVTTTGLSVWRLHAETETHLAWPTNGFST
ncbi:MAG: hypothetical protein HY260_03640 [Chloroflexi bacterium]|nr:hypothetical protein [Chloroflexota bacterium]